MSEARAEHSGLLQQAPDWLDEVISSLPRRDMSAVRKTCKHLARHVMQNVRGITLKLEKKVPVASVESCRLAITQLLDVQRGFKVRISAAGTQPFPTALSERVQSLWLTHPATCANNFQWGALTSLQKLDWYQGSTDDDVANLCEALEQGHLRQLTSLNFYDSHNGSNMLYARLAMGLADHLTSLSTDNLTIMHHIRHYQLLTEVQLTIAEVPRNSLSELFLALCRLPQLFTFEFDLSARSVRGASWVKGGHAENGKRWIITHHVPYQFLDWLPFAELQTVEFSGIYAGCTTAEVNVLRKVLQEHGEKVICTPYVGPGLAVDNLNPQTQLLVKHVHGTSTINVHRYVDLDLLHTVWKVTPACITQVRFIYHDGPGWHLFWNGLPLSVSKVELYKCAVRWRELRDLIAATPLHVTTLVVVPRAPNSSANFTLTGQFYTVQQLTADMFVGCAPPHLHLEFHPVDED